MGSRKLALDWIKRVLSDPKEVVERSDRLQESWQEPSPVGHAHRADLTRRHLVVESHSLAREGDASC
jgi:hypothetical protein